MSNTYNPILLNKITDDVVIEILNTLIPTLQELGINYFVVGAFARDAELLAKGHTDEPKRKTNDLDLAVMMANEEAFEHLKIKIGNIDGFELHSTEPIKLIYQQRYEVDLLPFGEIENEKGQVELKAHRSFLLDMPGFKEVFPNINTIPTNQGYDLNVCSLPGVVLLKIIAWDDRKHRTKDITDIEYIISHLYLLEINAIIAEEEDLITTFENEHKLFAESVSARFIGRKIGEMILESHPLQTRILEILNTNTQNAENSPMGQLFSYDTLEDSVNIIKQILFGIEDKLSNKG